MENLMAVLADVGSDVLKTTIFLTDTPDFSKVHAIYAKCLPSDPPVDSCVVVAAALPRG